MASSASTSSEAAVRSYLSFLEDPSSARDESVIKKARTAVGAAKDPIEKLRAMAELERAEAADGADLRVGFVRHAKTWAEDNGISAAAFRQLGVPTDVLAEARLTGAGGRRGGARRSASTGRTRARSVPVGVVKDAMLASREPFTISDITGTVGGSTGTVRKALDELVASKQVEKVGVAQDKSGPGRAPTLYAARR